MVSPARRYSPEQYVLKRLKSSRLQENLTDLVNVIAGLKNASAGRTGARGADRAVVDGHAAAEQADERVTR